MLLIWKQIVENPVYQKKEELLFVVNQKMYNVFGYRIKSEYSQCLHSKTNKQKKIQDFIKIHIPCMNTENL